MRGGKRSDPEKMQVKCAGENDFFDQEPISPPYAFRLGRHCFDIRSLDNYLTFIYKYNQAEPDKQYQKLYINPYTNVELTKAELAKISRKVNKVAPFITECKKNEKQTFYKLYDSVLPILSKYVDIEPGSEYKFFLDYFSNQYERKCPSDILGFFADVCGHNQECRQQIELFR
jgi:hypothetical protein